MTTNKPEQTKDPIWDQHLRWLDLVNDECKSNQLRREREKRREESLRQKAEDVARSS